MCFVVVNNDGDGGLSSTEKGISQRALHSFLPKPCSEEANPSRAALGTQIGWQSRLQ